MTSVHTSRDWRMPLRISNFLRLIYSTTAALHRLWRIVMVSSMWRLLFLLPKFPTRRYFCTMNSDMYQQLYGFQSNFSPQYLWPQTRKSTLDLDNLERKLRKLYLLSPDTTQFRSWFLNKLFSVSESENQVLFNC